MCGRPLKRMMLALVACSSAASVQRSAARCGSLDILFAYSSMSVRSLWLGAAIDMVDSSLDEPHSYSDVEAGAGTDVARRAAGVGCPVGRVRAHLRADLGETGLAAAGAH